MLTFHLLYLCVAFWRERERQRDKDIEKDIEKKRKREVIKGFCGKKNNLACNIKHVTSSM